MSIFHKKKKNQPQLSNIKHTKGSFLITPKPITAFCPKCQVHTASDCFSSALQNSFYKYIASWNTFAVSLRTHTDGSKELISISLFLVEKQCKSIKKTTTHKQKTGAYPMSFFCFHSYLRSSWLLSTLSIVPAQTQLSKL